MPLVFLSGAWAARRHSLGTAVVGGMIVSTVLNVIVIPAMYIIFDDGGTMLRNLESGRVVAVRVDDVDAGVPGRHRLRAGSTSR